MNNDDINQTLRRLRDDPSAEPYSGLPSSEDAVCGPWKGGLVGEESELVKAEAIDMDRDFVHQRLGNSALSDLVNRKSPPSGPLPDPDNLILHITFVSGGLSTAKWRGKELTERESGEWASPLHFVIDRETLAKGWLAKHKEKMPLDLHLSVSMNGRIQFGGKTQIFKGPPKQARAAGKHAGGKSPKKKKR